MSRHPVVLVLGAVLVAGCEGMLGVDALTVEGGDGDAAAASSGGASSGSAAGSSGGADHDANGGSSGSSGGSGSGFGDGGSTGTSSGSSSSASSGASDAGARDASGDAQACVASLSNVGTGDFHISFTLTTLATGLTVALLNQRAGCTSSGSPYWEITLSTSGGIVAATSDGVSTTTHFVEAGNAVNDGQPHAVVVQRVAGLLSYWRDGVLGSSTAADPDALGSLPALVTGSDACSGTVPLTGHGTISNVCMTTP